MIDLTDFIKPLPEEAKKVKAFDKNFFKLLKEDYYLLYKEPKAGSLECLCLIDKKNREIIVTVSNGEFSDYKFLSYVYNLKINPIILLSTDFMVDVSNNIVKAREFLNKITVNKKTLLQVVNCVVEKSLNEENFIQTALLGKLEKYLIDRTVAKKKKPVKIKNKL